MDAAVEEIPYQELKMGEVCSKP